MTTLEIIILVIVVLFALTWLYGIRYKMQTADRAAPNTINTTFLIFVSILIVLIFDISAYHLLWMIPASVIIGLLSLMFPFSLISFLSIPLEKIAYIGLDWNKIKKLQDDIQEVIKLMKDEKLTKEEAIKRVKEKSLNKNKM